MAQQTRSIIKNWFRTGLKPVQQQFWDWIDSFWHKDDSIPTASVDGLDAILQGIPTSEQIQVIEDLQPKTIVVDGSGIYALPAGKLLQNIVLTTSTNNTIKIGFTADGSEIDENTVSNDKAYVISYAAYFTANTDIHFTGDCTALIYLR